MPNAVTWKRAAKRWRRTARRYQEQLWRKEEALRRAGVSIMLANRAFDEDRGDRTIIFTSSTEGINNNE